MVYAETLLFRDPLKSTSFGDLVGQTGTWEDS